MNRVVFLRASNGFFGAERVVVGLAHVLGKYGWQAELCVFDSRNDSHLALVREAENAKIPTRVVPCSGRFDIQSIRWIRNLLSDVDASNSVLHTHDFKSNLYGRVAARHLNIPTVSTVHGWTSDTSSVRLYESVDRYVLSKFDAVICVSQSTTERLQKRAKLVHQLSNGVDTSEFSPTISGFGHAHWGIPENDYVFGVFSRLSREKGYSVLLNAFRTVCADVQNTHLLITGSGPEEASIHDEVRELDLQSRVTVVPAHMDVQRALHDLDCYVSASLTEGMPMIVLESMASEIPVIATAVGALPQMLDDDCGILVSPGDVENLSAAMLGAVQADQSMREKAVRARERVSERYSLKNQAEAHASIYAQLLSQL